MLPCCQLDHNEHISVKFLLKSFIQENTLETVVCEMAAILSRPQCVKVSKSFSGLIYVLARYLVPGGSWDITCNDIPTLDINLYMTYPLKTSPSLTYTLRHPLWHTHLGHHPLLHTHLPVGHHPLWHTHLGYHNFLTYTLRTSPPMTYPLKTSPSLTFPLKTSPSLTFPLRTSSSLTFPFRTSPFLDIPT